MKKVFKNFLYLSLGLALVSSACSDKNNDIPTPPTIDVFVGNYTGVINVDITGMSINDTVAFKFEKVSDTDFNLKAMNVNVLGNNVDITLKATGLVLSITPELEDPTTSGTFKIAEQSITIVPVGALTIVGTAAFGQKDGIILSTKIEGVTATSIDLEASGTMTLTADPNNPVPILLSVAITKD